MPGGLGDAPHPVEGVTPDAPVRPTGLALERQHVGDQRPVVAEAVDPREAAAQEIALDPTSVLVVKMGEPAVVAVDAPGPERKPDRASQGQFRERRPRVVGEGLDRDVRPAERQLGGLDADEAHLASVFKHQRIPVDDVDDPGRPARDQTVGGGEGGDARDQQYRQDDFAQSHAGTVSRGAPPLIRFGTPTCRELFQAIGSGTHAKTDRTREIPWH